MQENPSHMMAFIPRNLIQIRKAEKVSTSEQNIITKATGGNQK